MNALIGDIGNTITKICLIEFKNLKVRKIIYLNSKNILSKNLLLWNVYMYQNLIHGNQLKLVKIRYHWEEKLFVIKKNNTNIYI